MSFHIIIFSNASIQMERQRLQNPDEDDLVKMQDVVKTFGNMKAVNGVTFGIKRNECFGLLGELKHVLLDLITLQRSQWCRKVNFGGNVDQRIKSNQWKH
jgi:ABC-type branched-subunit amino acid transport system ATPase component